jgi:hypothetical protein
MRTIQQLSILALLALTTAGAALADAPPQPSAEVLLPIFEVDLAAGGRTTLFAVANALDEPVEVTASVRTNWGIPVLQVPLTLAPREVRTVNLHAWIVRGELPAGILDEPERAHLEAALAGRRSPKDDLYYGKELAPNRAMGSIVFTTSGRGIDALWGDYFLVDPGQDLAMGDTLVNLDRSTGCLGVCSRHALRFLLGAAFDGGTELVIWSPRQGRPSSDPEPPGQRFSASSVAFDEAGRPMDQRDHELLPLELVRVEELGLSEPFGWLDLLTESEVFIGVLHSADHRYSVGLQTYCLPRFQRQRGPGIRIRKLTNGEDANAAPGPSLAVGSPVLWEYEVANVGDTPLSGIQVTDDQGVAVTCPHGALQPGQTMTCTGHGSAVACQYRNVGEATASAPGGVPVSAQDASHYFGIQAGGIEVDLSIAGHADAGTPPGPALETGTPFQLSAQVKNSGPAPLTGIRLRDDQGTAVACPRTELGPGESMTCSTPKVAVTGARRHAVTVSGEPACGPPVEAGDAVHYQGFQMTMEALPAVDLEKLTNGHDADTPTGPQIQVGAPVLWEYVVTNTGDLTLESVSVADDQGVVVSCPKSVLQPEESMTCTGQGVAVAGQYANVGTVSAQGTNGAAVTDSDPSHYFGIVPPPPPPPPVAGDQGCTPGYWKNHPDSWPAAGYSTGQSVQSVFAQAAGYPGIGGATLLEALNLHGGSGLDGAARNLLRAAVASLLDASHPGVAYPRTPASVISDVDSALATGDPGTIEALKNALDADNNLGCPLS